MGWQQLERKPRKMVVAARSPTESRYQPGYEICLLANSHEHAMNASLIMTECSGSNGKINNSIFIWNLCGKHLSPFVYLESRRALRARWLKALK